MLQKRINLFFKQATFFSLVFNIFLHTPASASYDVISLTSLIVDQTGYFNERELNQEVKHRGLASRISAKTLTSFNRRFGHKLKPHIGGSATNTLRGLARFGHKCAIIGRLGNDKIAKHYQASIEKYNMDVLYKSVSSPTAQVICLIDPQGERSMLSYIPQETDPQPGDIPYEVLKGAKILHLDGYALLFDHEVLGPLVNFAAEQKIKISFSAGSVELINQHLPRFKRFIRHFADILFASGDEAMALTGAKTPEEAAKLLSQEAPITVVHTGNQGGYALFKENNTGCIRTLQYRAKAVENVVDGTGAGDLFAAGFLHALLSKQTIAEACQQGAILGAAVVQVEGAELPLDTTCFKK